MSQLLNSVIVMDPSRVDEVYGPDQIEEINRCTHLLAKPMSAAEAMKREDLIREVDVIFGGWGMPVLSAENLDLLPRLKAVFYAAGTVKSFVRPAVWDRNLIVTNAHVANAVPVAEYCVGAILFSLKLGWRQMRQVREERRWIRDRNVPGAFGTTVGLVSLGAIGVKTLELLAPYDLKRIVYSTSLSAEKAAELGVERVSLGEIFERSDVVSLHTAALPETKGMIRGDHFRSMRKNATFINTARGSVVNQPEMIAALRERPDLNAVIDVADPEPPADGDEIFDVPNLFITPHIGGSLNHECRRLGQTAIDECKRFLAGAQPQNQVTAGDLARMA